MKDIYKMNLNESISLGRKDGNMISVVRVPGGWIYIFKNGNPSGGLSTTSSFVPFSKEFVLKDD